MSRILSPVCACVLMAGAAASAVSAATFPVLLEQNYDADTVGSLPSGWSVVSGAAPNAVVQNGVPGTPSTPNVFQVQQNGESFTIQTVSPTQVTLDASSPNLVWSMRLYVDELVANFSAGVQFKLWNADISNLDVGYYRILSSSATTFSFFNPLAGGNGGAFTIGSYNRDQWYDVSLVIDPSSTSAGTATLYVDGVAVNTETYSGRGIGQTSAIDTFQILSQPNDSADNRLYIDNFQIAVPEPASIGLIALGTAALARRRRA